MQRIERYGVIALILLLVTIAAVSFWEDAEEKRATEPDLEARRARVAQADATNRSATTSGSRHTLSGNDRGIVGELPATARNGDRSRDEPSRRGGASSPGGQNSGAAKAPAGEAGRPRKPGFQPVPPRPESADPTIADPGFDGDETGNPVRGGAASPGGWKAPARDPERGREDAEVSFPDSLAALESSSRERTGAVPASRQDPPSRGEVVPDSPPKPASRGGSPAASGGTYVVAAGDTLSQIAEKCLGSSRRWPEIQQLNGGIEPAKIHVGLELRLPSGTAVAAATPTPPRTATPAPPRAATSTPRPPTAPVDSSTIYVVRPGDTFSTIAERELGSSRRWREIAALNPKVDPKRMFEGARLRMPSSSGPVVASAARAAAPTKLARVEPTPRKKPRVR